MTDLDEANEEVRGGKGRREDGGASIVYRDPRVSKALGWFWGVVGAGIAGGSWIAASNLYQLNISVNRMTDNNAVVAAQLQDHEARLRQAERDLNTIQGRNLRGGPEVQVPRGH